jgi:hypothetical protein
MALFGARRLASSRTCARRRNGDQMGVPTFVVLTIAVFAALGLAQKLVERL